MKEDQTTETMKANESEEAEDGEVEETPALTFVQKFRRKLDFGFFHALKNVPPFRAIYADIYILSSQLSEIAVAINNTNRAITVLANEIGRIQSMNGMKTLKIREGSTNTELPDLNFDKRNEDKPN